MRGSISAPVAAGFNNGIGNFVIYTQVLQALAYASGCPVDLVLDSDSTSPGSLAAAEIGKRLDCVRDVVLYDSDFDPDRYSLLHVSLHSNGGLMHTRFTKGRDYDILDSWANSLISESCFYYSELRELYGYKGPYFDQVVAWDLGVYRSLKRRKKRVISVANGCTGSEPSTWERKRYPHWAESLRLISEVHPNCEFHLLGGKKEVEWAEGVANAVPNCVVDAGRLSILESIAVIAASECFLGNDTGMLHCADALGIPIVGVYGSTLLSKNAPINSRYVCVCSPLACAPCQGTFTFVACKHPNLCMETIPAGWIATAFANLNQLAP